MYEINMNVEPHLALAEFYSVVTSNGNFFKIDETNTSLLLTFNNQKKIKLNFENEDEKNRFRKEEFC